MKNKIMYFVTGSQDLYGDDVLKQVDIDSREMVSFLNENPSNPVTIKYLGTVKNNEQIVSAVDKINFEGDAIGMIVWCHTFSPAKMWINGLKKLNKPMLHLHTQANRDLPYDKIDMDFMNLNQSAHGDRELGHICARLNITRKVVAGYYEDEQVLSEIYSYARLCAGVAFSQNLKVVRFGDNMREVAVTDGDKVSAQISFGWQVNYYGIGDLCEEITAVKQADIDSKYAEYIKKYELNTSDVSAVKEQISYEIAIEKFLKNKNSCAFTTNFQDLHGLNQLPGMAVQNLMAKGIGFGAEGDWKTSALAATLKYAAGGKSGASAFMEDYTYDLKQGEELVLGSHMLEVDPTIAISTPKIEVHPLGIGDRNPPARLVFDGMTGEGLALSLVDMGSNFKLIIAKIEMVKQPKPMPKLPVARVMWRLKPNFKEGAKRWIEEGGAHHTVVTTQFTSEELVELAKLFKIDYVVIG